MPDDSNPHGLRLPAAIALAIAAALLLAAAAPDRRSDLPDIKAARSIVAEWAMLNRLDSEGKLPPIYVRQMRAESRRQLSLRLNALSDSGSAAAQAMRETLRLPAEAAFEPLEKAAARLHAIETQLEGA